MNWTMKTHKIMEHSRGIYWLAEDVMYEVEGATKEQAEAWLLDYEDSIAEIVGEAFHRVLEWNRDEIEVEQTEEQED